MFRSFPVGRVLGFPITINLSFLLLVPVFLALFGVSTGIWLIVSAFSSVLLHELGHAVVARRLGTRVHSIDLHFFGGAAKIESLPRSARDEIAIAAAGPAVSFALGGLSLVLASLTGWAWASHLTWLNFIIGGFNLVPALPLDGGRIFRAALSYKLGFRRATEIATVVSRGFALALGIIGLVTLQLFIAALAVLLWFMAKAELRSLAFVRDYGTFATTADDLRTRPYPLAADLYSTDHQHPTFDPRLPYLRFRRDVTARGQRIIIEFERS